MALKFKNTFDLRIGTLFWFQILLIMCGVLIGHTGPALAAGPQITPVGMFIGKAFNWNWGELYFDSTYTTELKITNDCPQPRNVKLAIANALKPYLTIEGHSKPIPAKAKDHPLKVTITTPPEPKPKPKPDPLDYFIFPNAMVEILHEGLGNCMQAYTEYHVSGHAHRKPISGGRLPQGLCRVWWETLEKPKQLSEEEDCLEEFRELAKNLIQAILPIHIAHDPQKWSWLPSILEIQHMSSQELLVLKARADSLLATTQ